MLHYRETPEDDRPTKRIRCPVHGFIHYSRNEQLVMDDPYFQRLRRIGQLALCHYVYPGAMHTRFEHSLGVMEMVSRAFNVLALKNEALLTDTLSALPGLECETLLRAHKLLRLVGLLHDVGHAPFSHAGEFILHQEHETLSNLVIREKLGEMISERFFEEAPELMCEILLDHGDFTDPKSVALGVLRQLIAGPMDLDRCDYLLRDSLHCGVAYGRFDYERLLESMTIFKDEEGEPPVQIGIDPSGIHSFEALILARYQMSTQVYYHKLRRAYDLLLKNYLKALWPRDEDRSPDAILSQNDFTVWAQIEQDANSAGTSERAKWAKRILDRRHPKVVYERGDHADAEDLRKIKRIAVLCREKFPNAEILMDVEARGKTHKLFVKGDSELIDDLFIVNEAGGGRSKGERLTNRSGIISKIPKTFWVLRIFGYFERSEDLGNARRMASEME